MLHGDANLELIWKQDDWQRTKSISDPLTVDIWRRFYFWSRMMGCKANLFNNSMFLFCISSCGKITKVQPVKVISSGSCYKAGASEKFQKCFRKSLEGEREREREIFPLILCLSGTTSIQHLCKSRAAVPRTRGPRRNQSRFVANLKPGWRTLSLTQIRPAVTVWAVSARDVFM